MPPHAAADIQAQLAALKAASGTDWPRAAGLAARLVATAPALREARRLQLAALRALGRFAEAAAPLAQAAALFPDESWPLAEAALTARAAGDHAAARTHAAALRAADPADETGYRIGITAARALSLPEAAALLAEAMARFPAQPWPLAEAAALAAERGDAAAATPFATELRSRFPDDPDGWRLGIAAATASGDSAGARALRQASLTLFPDAAWPLAEALAAARAAPDPAGAAHFAAALRTRFPGDERGWRAGAALLRAAGRIADAAALLRDARPHHPGTDWPAREAAALDRLAANHAAAAPRAAALARALPDTPARPRVVVILGMHRAGTSLCARLVQALGIPLGTPLMSPGPDNPEGYQEHLDVFTLHRTLLEALGDDWDTLRLAAPLPPDAWHGAPAAAARAAMADTLAAQLAANAGRWAFKDPRTARFLPLWREVFETLGITPTWILAVRDPRAVAASLHARDHIPPELGALLWAEHYLDALRHLGPALTAIVHYERWFPTPDTQLARLAHALGLPPAGTDAIRESLRHNIPGTDTPMPALAGHLHAMLCAENPDLRALQAEATALWQASKGKEEPLF